MGVGINRERAPRRHRNVQELERWIKPFRPTIDLDGGAVLGARSKHRLGIELRRLAFADHSSGAMPEDVDVRRRNRSQHSLRHRVAIHTQLRMNARHHHIESGQNSVVVVQRAVLQNVDLDARQDTKRCHRLVECSQFLYLLSEPFSTEAVSNGEPRRMVGHDDVVVTE